MSSTINNTSPSNLLQMRMDALQRGADDGGSAATGAEGPNGANTVAGQGASGPVGAGWMPDALLGRSLSTVFEAIDKALDGDKPKQVAVKDPDASLARMDAALAKLREANNASIDAGGFSGGSIMQSLARAMIEMQAHQRTAALQSRSLAYEQAQAHSMNQAEKMNDAADDMDAGADKAIIINAVVGGIGLAMSAGATIGGGIQLGKMIKAGRALDGAADVADGAADASKLASTSKLKANAGAVPDIVPDNGKLAGAGKTSPKPGELTTDDIDELNEMTVGTRELRSSKGNDSKFRTLSKDEISDHLGIARDPVTSKGAAKTSSSDVLSQADQKRILGEASMKREFADALSGLGDTLGKGGAAQASAQETRAQADAKRDEAKGAEESAQATAAQQRADVAKDVQGQMEEMIKKIIEFVREMQDAEVEAMRAITRG